LAEDTAYEEARTCAHRILRQREKSEHDLLKRLQEKGHTLAAAEKVVERFKDVGLVDDARFTETYISSAQYSGKGWYRILRELRQRGIDTELLEPPPDEEELERASQVITRLPVSTLKEQERALRRLVTRGYGYGVARQAIAARVKEFNDDGSSPDSPANDSAENEVFSSPFDVRF